MQLDHQKLAVGFKYYCVKFLFDVHTMATSTERLVLELELINNNYFN